MKDEESSKQNDLDRLLQTLALLQVVAPATTIDRIRKRIQLFQLSRDLVEKQVYGFWIALHAFFTVIFRLSSKSSAVAKKRTTR